MPPLLNAVHLNCDITIVVMDNQTTGMTGNQLHPEHAIDAMGRKATPVKIEDVARGLGVKFVEVVDPHNMKETKECVKRALEYKGTSLIVSRSPCILMENRRKRHAGEKIPAYEIDQEKCVQCKVCTDRFACPAFYKKDGRIYIDDSLCAECGVCEEVCPVGAIRKKEG